MRMEQIRKTISTNFSMIAIRENLDLRKFSAIRYIYIFITAISLFIGGTC